MTKQLYSKVSGLMFTALCATQLHAQIVDCNVFMQGNHLEVGISPNGAYGTSEVAPVGYHANITDSLYNPCTYSLAVNNELGFVADPNRTGWTSYIGDFILPGRLPHEGWMISDSTGTGTAYSSYYGAFLSTGFTGPLTGSNTGYSVSGSTIEGGWNGIFGGDSITVNQYTTIDTGNLYLQMHISFSKPVDSTTDTFYYLRSVNPHNEYVLTSNLGTKLKVEYQLPNLYNMTMVSAAGLSDSNNYMALGTVDMRARGFLIPDSTMPYAGTLASIYNGDSTHYQYGGTVSGNYAMGLIFKIVLGPGTGDSTFIDFGYSFGAGVLDSVLGDSIITTGGLHTKNLYTSASISVYPIPTSNVINISGLNGGETLTLTDMLGRTVVTGVTANRVYSMSLASLPAGNYLLKVSSTDGKLESVTKVVRH